MNIKSATEVTKEEDGVESHAELKIVETEDGNAEKILVTLYRRGTAARYQFDYVDDQTAVYEQAASDAPHPPMATLQILATKEGVVVENYPAYLPSSSSSYQEKGDAARHLAKKIVEWTPDIPEAELLSHRLRNATHTLEVYGIFRDGLSDERFDEALQSAAKEATESLGKDNVEEFASEASVEQFQKLCIAMRRYLSAEEDKEVTTQFIEANGDDPDEVGPMVGEPGAIDWEDSTGSETKHQMHY